MICVHPTTGTAEFGSEQAFLDVVAADALGNATAEQAAWLRKPENLEIWRDALTDLIRKTHTEQTERRADIQTATTYAARQEAMLKHAKWSSRASYFLRRVESRLAEAKRLVHLREETRVDLRRDALTARIDALEIEMAALRRSVRAVADEVAS